MTQVYRIQAPLQQTAYYIFLVSLIPQTFWWRHRYSFHLLWHYGRKFIRSLKQLFRSVSPFKWIYIYLQWYIVPYSYVHCFQIYDQDRCIFAFCPLIYPNNLYNQNKEIRGNKCGIVCEYRSASYKQLPYNPIIGYWKTINPWVFPGNIAGRWRRDWESTLTCYNPVQRGLVRVVKSSK